MPSARKDPHGVYGLIDSVRFEPATGAPQRIQLWGVFAMADNIGIEKGEIAYVQVGGFKKPERGYLYYALNRRDTIVTRAEWAQLAEFAGTGKAVSFGGAFPPADSLAPKPTLDTTYARYVMNYNGQLRSLGEPAARPDTFPLRMPNTKSTIHADERQVMTLGLRSVR